jgi:hypothetical protein
MVDICGWWLSCVVPCMPLLWMVPSSEQWWCWLSGLSVCYCVIMAGTLQIALVCYCRPNMTSSSRILACLLSELIKIAKNFSFILSSSKKIITNFSSVNLLLWSAFRVHVYWLPVIMFSDKQGSIIFPLWNSRLRHSVFVSYSQSSSMSRPL